MPALYDTIGQTYANHRQPDPCIAKVIDKALGGANTILNVGAGSGSYEPEARQVTALEPSAHMVAQRPFKAAPVVRGTAEHLPFADNSFDAATAILTIHHWTDQEKGVHELRRVARGKIVFLTYDPNFRDLWLLDYFPQMVPLDESKMPQLSKFEDWLAPVKVTPVPIPHDCRDGFVAAFWRRPAAYLNESVRAGMSPFWKMGDISDELTRLETDIRDGTWEAQHGHLLELNELDCGYRLIETL